MSTKKEFQSFFSLSQRQEMSSAIRAKYPDKIPVLVFPIDFVPSREAPKIPKNKFLVKNHMLLSEFVFVIKKHLLLKPCEAIFIFINGRIPVMTKSVSELYNTETENDGILYILYSMENVFG
jgi:GABA(A) receptor-associated protein